MPSGFPDWALSFGSDHQGAARGIINYQENTSNADVEVNLLTVTGKGILKQITVGISTNAVSAAFLRLYIDGESTPSFEIDYDSLINIIGGDETNTQFSIGDWGITNRIVGHVSFWFRTDIRFKTSISIRIKPNTSSAQSQFILAQYLIFD